MKSIPAEIDGARILLWAETDSKGWNERTRHITGNQPVPAPTLLAICQYSGDSGIYLFYCNSDWQTLTDTMHDSVSEAKRQARFEFDEPLLWSKVAA